MSEWSLNPVGGWWAASAVMAALALVLLVKPVPTPSPGRLTVLRLLRLLASLMVGFALLRPALTHLRSEPLPASLLLLVDDSRSLSVEDSLGGRSRWDALRSMLADSTESLRRLSDRWEVKAFRFSDSLREVPVTDGAPQLPDEPLGEASALGAALEELMQREGGDRVAGVLLATDGAQRTAGERDTAPLAAARRLAAEGAPLFTFAFGRPGGAERPDLAIEDLLASDTVFAKTPVQVAGRLSVQGYAERTFRVQLMWEDADGKMTPVDAQQITAQPGVAAYPIRLSHTPEAAGEWKASLRVANEEGELLTGNNVQSTFITVREGGVKVMQLVGADRVGGQPGPEQRFVRAALAASPDVAVTRRVFDYRQEKIDLTDDLARDPFDVFLVDNLDSRALSALTWMALVNQVQDGAGLMMTGGRQSFGPGGFRDNPIGSVLPVGIGPAERQRLGEPWRTDVHHQGPLAAAPTALGRRGSILDLGGAAWSDLPPLEGANRFDPRLMKGNARVLLESNDNNRRPLLVAGQSGAGRTLAFAGDSTWRWPMRGFGDAHRRFWRQAVLWLAKRDDSGDNPVRLKLDARRIPRGGSVRFEASVQPDAVANADQLRCTAVITKPDGTTVDLPLPRGGSRVEGLFADVDQAGDFKVTVTATVGGREIGSASARFLAPEQDLELDNPAAEPALLAQMAQLTAEAGGAALAPEELPDLLARLAAAPPETSEQVVARVTHWDTWPFFLTLVALLGLEWFLRKRWGLV